MSYSDNEVFRSANLLVELHGDEAVAKARDIVRTMRVGDDTKAEPDTLYGAMHLAREVMLKTSMKAPLGILRPPLSMASPTRTTRMVRIGSAAPPRRRARLRLSATARKCVTTYWSTISSRSPRACFGNGATARCWARPAVPRASPRRHSSSRRSFRRPRKSSYRRDSVRLPTVWFDIAATRKACPDVAFTPLDEGIARVHTELSGHKPEPA